MTHSRNCDSLELCHRLQHAEDIDDILLKNPTWKRAHGCRLCGLKDYSSETEWKVDLEVNHIELRYTWMAGKAHAVNFLDISDRFYSDLSNGVTTLKPNKRLAGVTVDEDCIENAFHSLDEEEEVENLEDAEAAREIEETLADCPEPASENVISNKIDYDGKQIYKTSIIKEFFGGSKIDLTSTDRLKRVRGYSKFNSSEEQGEINVDLDDSIIIGDYVAGRILVEKQITQSSLCIAKILSLKDRQSGIYKTAIPSNSLGNTEVTAKIMPAKVVDGFLKFVPSNGTPEVVWDGNKCTTVAIEDFAINLEEAISLFSLLPLVSPKRIKSSLLPYDDSFVEATDDLELKEKAACKVCSKEVGLKKMRLHVGKHILEGNLVNVCGFCGSDGCSINLVKSSGRGNSSTLGPQSNCVYFSKFSLKSAETSTKSSPCTNRPFACPVCETVVWTYMMSYHYAQVHKEATSQSYISSAEKEMVLSKK